MNVVQLFRIMEGSTICLSLKSTTAHGSVRQRSSLDNAKSVSYNTLVLAKNLSLFTGQYPNFRGRFNRLAPRLPAVLSLAAVDGG